MYGLSLPALSPVLYFVCTNGLPVHSRVTLSLFTDDAVFHNSSLSLRQVSVICSVSLDVLPDWLRKWSTAVNEQVRSDLLYTSVPLLAGVTNSVNQISEVPGRRAVCKILEVTSSVLIMACYVCTTERSECLKMIMFLQYFLKILYGKRYCTQDLTGDVFTLRLLRQNNESRYFKCT